MAVYQFRARERAGAIRAGQLQAGDESAAMRMLEEQGLLPIRLVREESAAGPSGSAGALAGAAPGASAGAAAGAAGAPSLTSFFRKRVSPRDLITYTRQLETLLDSGISLTQSLFILADQTSSAPLREATRRVQDAVEQGHSFAEALGGEPGAFPSLYVNMIRAGEEGGVMAAMLERTATLLEHEFETRERVKSALFYPNLVLGELVLAFVVLMKLVMPRFAAFFQGLGADLPLPTKVMMGMSAFVEKNGLWILAGAAAALVAGWFYVRTPAGRWNLHRLQIRAPILGDLLLKSLMSRFARVLAALLASGVPITVALDIVRRVVDNVVVEREVAAMKDGIVEGKGVTGTLTAGAVFPPLVIKMLAVGEETGALDKMLVKVSGYFDRDVEHAVKNLTAAIEPILLVIMGVSVLFIALAVFLPMWNLMQALHH